MPSLSCWHASIGFLEFASSFSATNNSGKRPLTTSPTFFFWLGALHVPQIAEASLLGHMTQMLALGFDC